MNMRDVMGVILSGGQGQRLYPLTKYRSKPAVPLAGKYRLIDIPISNCLNSQINKVFVLTQFNSASLNKHIVQTYRFDMFNGGFVEVLAAEQTPDNQNWFLGTADAVRQSIKHILPYETVKNVIILSGDQLYQMDLRLVVDAHIQNNSGYNGRRDTADRRGGFRSGHHENPPGRPESSLSEAEVGGFGGGALDATLGRPRLFGQHGDLYSANNCSWTCCELGLC
jgi:hypothetical protein